MNHFDLLTFPTPNFLIIPYGTSICTTLSNTALEVKLQNFLPANGRMASLTTRIELSPKPGL